MNSEKEYITDAQWENLAHAISLNKEEIERLFVSLYLLLKIRRDGVVANKTKNDERCHSPAKSVDYYLKNWNKRRGAMRYVHLSRLLCFMDYRIMRKRTSLDMYPFYKEVLPIPLPDFPRTNFGSFSIIPIPFNSEVRYGYMKDERLSSFLPLHCMVIDKDQDEGIKLECDEILNRIHPINRNAMGLHSFDRHFQGIDQLPPLRLLIASPSSFCKPIISGAKENFFCETLWRASDSSPSQKEDQCLEQLSIESKEIIDICISKTIDILLLPEMMITQGVLNTFREALLLRCNEGDKQYPWLTVAGSSHCLEDDLPCNISCILDPFGETIWKQHKISSYPSEEGCEGISSDKKITLIDIPGIGRVVVTICRDYLAWGETILTEAWPTHILIPAFSKTIKHFFDTGISLLSKHFISSAVSNHCDTELENMKRVLAASARKYTIYYEKVENPPQKIPLSKLKIDSVEELKNNRGLKYWKNLYLVEL